MSDFHTLQTKSGRVFTPLYTDDVVEVIRDEMGDDIADYLEEVIYDAKLEQDDKYAGLEAEFHNYEQSCENWHNFVEDTAERLETVRRKIEDNKLTKAKISIELWQIYKDMRGEL